MIDPILRALPPIPERLSYRIGEVSRLVGVKPHVLRFWEREFSQVRPRKSSNGHRLYARGDVERLRRIRVLVHSRGLTLAGARSLLEEGDAAVEAFLAHRPSEAAREAEEATDAVRRLDAEVKRLTAQLKQAEKRADKAEAEAGFWKVEARKSSARLKKVVSLVKNGLAGFKMFNETVDGPKEDL